MISAAFLQELGGGRLKHEETLVSQVLTSRGIPTTLFTAKRIRRRQLPLRPDTFVCGDMDAMHGAMRQLGIPVPEPDDYPRSLQPLFHRRIWRSTLGEVKQGIYDDSSGPLFVKPRAALRCSRA